MTTAHQSIDFSIAYYSGDRKTGSITVIKRKNGETTTTAIDTVPASDLPAERKPVFIGLTEENKVILLDPDTKKVVFKPSFPADAFAAHIYSDPNSKRDWFMNDGDKATGNDQVNCGDKGSSVTVIDDTTSANSKFLRTICVGRGHHQASFSYPSDEHPNTPSQAYISNLKDGTISVIGNNPTDTENYLSVVTTVNLCEPDKEDDKAEAAIPNNAFPHGLVFSKVSGKVYNLNNGYGTVVVINPTTCEIENRFSFKGHSNLFASPCGKYVLGRGADRKSNPNHVIAKLSVIDVSDNAIKDSLDLQDVYISKYFFNPEGSHLYLTTSSSGNDEQKANLKTDALLVFDMKALPKLKLINETRLGVSTGTLDFVTKNNETQLMFSSNAEEGAVAVMNVDGEVIEKIPVAKSAAHSRLWTL